MVGLFYTVVDRVPARDRTSQLRTARPVAVVTVDRPQRRNAVDDATAEALGDAWERFDDDEDALVGVLTGSEGTFSAGADLKAMDLEDRPEGWLGFTRTRVSKPTVAAMQ
jgi:enoyl-CoA hydratase